MKKLVVLCFFAITFVNSFVVEDDLKLHFTVPELIKQNGYPCREYKVTTSDGYILTLHRIPHPPGIHTAKKNQTVFLMHGLLGSSADWILSGPEKSLAYLLSQEGYDVWMGNARGNDLSRAHSTLDPNTDSKFWQLSWEEIGRIDLPTMIDFILKKTKRKDLFYIGHSQGTTAFFVMASELPEYNHKIRAQFSLAPIAFMNHMTSPFLRVIAYFEGPLEYLFDIIGVDEFLPNSNWTSLLGESLCKDGDITQIICTNTLFMICGFSPKEFNATMLPYLVSYTPAGASTKQMLHYAQEIRSGHFRRYDYGSQNKKIYGKSQPPDFDLNQVTAPVYLFYSHNDWLAAETDVLKLYRRLPNVKGRFLVTESEFNHLDYIFGMQAKEHVYNKIISLLSRYKNKK